MPEVASMTKLFIFVVLSITGLSCNPSVVRDETTYRMELDFLEQVATQQADSLTGFIQRTCKCEGDIAALKFTTPECTEAAKKVVVVNSRMAWHKAMMLYNAGLLESRPPKDPPEVPAFNTLCPKN